MKTCRGCAGTGIGQHVSPRTIAILESFGRTWCFLPEDPRRHRRALHVSAARERITGVPLAIALQKAEAWLADGFRYNGALLPLDPAWKCSWCHGTGTPQLSVGTMQAVLT